MVYIYFLHQIYIDVSLSLPRAMSAFGHHEEEAMLELMTRSHIPERQQLASVQQEEPISGLPDSVGDRVQGTVKPGFEPVRDAFLANLDSGADIGASTAVFIDGEAVVDLCGGHFDATYTRPFDNHTIVNGFSSTKTMTALCALVLADRGEIDLNAPVKKYWPEFAAAGKDRIEVRHIVSHTSGLAGWTEPMTLQDIYDWEKSTTLLARQAPWWEPGTASGYHAFNMGHLVGEVVLTKNRTPRRSLGRRRRFDVVCGSGCAHGLRLYAEPVDYGYARTGPQHECAEGGLRLPFPAHEVTSRSKSRSTRVLRVVALVSVREKTSALRTPVASFIATTLALRPRQVT